MRPPTPTLLSLLSVSPVHSSREGELSRGMKLRSGTQSLIATRVFADSIFHLVKEKYRSLLGGCSPAHARHKSLAGIVMTREIQTYACQVFAAARQQEAAAVPRWPVSTQADTRLDRNTGESCSKAKPDRNALLGWTPGPLYATRRHAAQGTRGNQWPTAQWRCQDSTGTVPSGPRLIKAPVPGRRCLQVCWKQAEPDFERRWERFVAAKEEMACL
ncbi:Double-stranded RNA-specific editase B2 [Liparis tanakae]|uniref:Double-stranded RNA-specific editase B2 n=1 Tax=Liparis tanakae TaxID=230148 RepID=A0A4Z2HEZ1_9TELE|nr:Double-stranded RNA-specific editase B2 [Liparis tanakae]